ncbi:MAG: PadR family transcriptional regulator [Luteitalea sp.]|nr:PadR family transcriptional regulator [Luteitalea sp.]
MGHRKSGELLQGTLPLLILRVLVPEPNHGFAIARRIQQISKDVLRVEEGSLYPALHKMELEGWIASEWGLTENHRKAKYYKLTRTGRKQLKHETGRWDAIAGAIAAILQEA